MGKGSKLIKGNRKPLRAGGGCTMIPWGVHWVQNGLKVGQCGCWETNGNDRSIVLHFI